MSMYQGVDMRKLDESAMAYGRMKRCIKENKIAEAIERYRRMFENSCGKNIPAERYEEESRRYYKNIIIPNEIERYKRFVEIFSQHIRDPSQEGIFVVIKMSQQELLEKLHEIEKIREEIDIFDDVLRCLAGCSDTKKAAGDRGLRVSQECYELCSEKDEELAKYCEAVDRLARDAGGIFGLLYNKLPPFEDCRRLDEYLI